MTKFTIKSYPQGQVWVSLLTDFYSTLLIIFTSYVARVVELCMDRTNWGQLTLRLQNLAMSQIQMLRYFLRSFTHQGRFVSIAHSIEVEILTYLPGYPGCHFIL